MLDLLKPKNLDNTALSRLRKNYAMLMSIVGVGAGIIGLVLEASAGSTSALPITIIFTIICGVLIYLTRRNYLSLVSVLLISVFTLSSIFASSVFVLVGTFALISAAVLGNTLIFITANILIFGAQIIHIAQLLTPGSEVFATPEVTQNILTVIAFGVISFFLRYLIITTERSGVEAKSSAKLLQDVAETGEVLAKMLNLKEVLPRAVELIRERFAFYHVQIFLLDETEQNARLVASTGALGQKLFERQHSLPVGSKSVIGQVTSTGKSVIARDTDPIYYRNELLPNTRSELALPIFDGDSVIGALDVQSRRPDAFDSENVQALQVMANLLGTSIRNARLFETQERSGKETKRLFLETEASLRENQRLNQMLTRQGWTDFLELRQQVQGITINDEEVIIGDEWSDAQAKAAHTRQMVNSDNGHGIIAVPVMLGTEVIGAIEVEPSPETPQSEVAEMVRSIAQRLALSLDKARLFEESQEATAREQRINDIVGRYQSVSNVDELLKITLAELGQSLGAKSGAIRLGLVGVPSLNDGEVEHD